MTTFNQYTIQLKHHSIDLEIKSFKNYRDFAIYVKDGNIPKPQKCNLINSLSFNDDQKRSRNLVNRSFMEDFLTNPPHPAVISLTTVGFDDAPKIYLTHNYPVTRASWNMAIKTHGIRWNVTTPSDIGVCLYDFTETVDPPEVDCVRYSHFKENLYVPSLSLLLSGGVDFYRVYPARNLKASKEKHNLTKSISNVYDFGEVSYQQISLQGISQTHL